MTSITATETVPTATTFRLPDFEAICKFPLLMNPLYEAVRADSIKWVKSFEYFASNPRKRAFFEAVDYERMASYAYPTVGYDELRVICDLMSCQLVADDVSDDQNGPEARKTMETYLGGLAGEPCDGSLLSQMSCDVGYRLRQKFKPNALRRFLASSKLYVDAVAREAELRASGTGLGLEEYKVFRRSTVSSRTWLDLYEYCYGFELPDEVVQDPVFDRMSDVMVDLVSLTNDAHSYKMEHAKGLSTMSILPIIMREKHFSLQEASDYLASLYSAKMTQFSAEKAELERRSYGKETDANLRLYVCGLESWIVGVIAWGFRSTRYFGDSGEEVSKTLYATLH